LLFRFVNEVRKGDLVVYRSKVTKLIHIGRIIDGYEYKPSLDPDYPHQRPTSWLHTVEPKKMTQGALYEIGSAITFFQVRNFADEWLGLLSSGSDERNQVKPIGRDDDPTVA
jgi:restriction system protein